MIKKGLLSRQRTKDDARANAVSITAAGRRVLSSAQGAVNRAESGALNVLPKGQQGGFMNALRAYAEALDAMGDDAAPAKSKKGGKKKAPAKRKAGRKAKRR
jgi:DNA-binding MarR family transcriptional regulator